VKWDGGIGTTRDFSALGVYFETPGPPPVGESIEFYMKLNQAGLSEFHRICFRGEIVRIEPNGSKTGIAVAIQSHSFEGVCAPEEE
jgi:hypothetical protein